MLLNDDSLWLLSYTWRSFFFCLLQTTWAVDNFTSFATTLHIMWFALLRFVSLQWPTEFKGFTSQYVKVIISNKTFSSCKIPQRLLVLCLEKTISLKIPI